MAHVVLDVEPLRASSVERRASSVGIWVEDEDEDEVELAKYLGVDFAAPATMLVIAQVKTRRPMPLAEMCSVVDMGQPFSMPVTMY